MKTWGSDQSRKLLYLLGKETISLWRTDKTENFGLGVVSGEEIKEDKGYFNKFVCTDFLATNSLSLVIRMSSFWHREGTFHLVLSPAFRKSKVRVPFLHLLFLKWL